MNALEASTEQRCPPSTHLDPDPDPDPAERRTASDSSCSPLCWSVNKPRPESPYHQPPPSYEETRARDAAEASRHGGRPSPLSISMSTPMATVAGSGVAGATAATPPQGPIILHKSSKALYRAVAAQWGIACKMTDHCRCLDCQSHYFDCDYDLNEHDKTDGGLAAGSPIFISEVIHGTACSIL